MKPALLKESEMVIPKNDFGILVEEFVRKILNYNPYTLEWVDAKLREWWPQLGEYYQRHIQTAIEVTLELNKHPYGDRKPLPERHKEMWEKFIKDVRPPKSPFTIDYHCHKCKAKGVKLWRGVHGCEDADGNELLCASCLAPDIKVSDKGKAHDESIGFETDQIRGWLPAVPVDDTYWGYSSVPSQDVEWWVGLPTYLSK